MTSSTPDLIEALYAASLEPESFAELLHTWDHQVSHSSQPIEEALGLLGHDSLQKHLHRATQIADSLLNQPSQPFGQLLAQFRTAAMVVASPNLVLSANAAASTLFQAIPQQPLQPWNNDRPAHASLLDAIQAMALEKPTFDAKSHPTTLCAMPTAHCSEHLIRFQAAGDDRLMFMHLRSLPPTPAHQRPILIVTSEYTWSEAMTTALQNNFKVTTAEIQVLRHLATGHKVTAIATQTGKSVGTVRAQLNSLMEKTNIRSQNDLLRLVSLLLQSTTELPSPPKAHPSTTDNIFHHILLADGRKLDYVTTLPLNGVPF